MQISRQIILPVMFISGVPCVGERLEQIQQALETKYSGVEFIPQGNRSTSRDLLYVVKDEVATVVKRYSTDAVAITITNPNKDFEVIAGLIIAVLTGYYEEKYSWLKTLAH